jgi:hypothetical protein
LRSERLPVEADPLVRDEWESLSLATAAGVDARAPQS